MTQLVFALAPAGIERGECALDEFDGAFAVGARKRDARLRRELENLPVEIDRVPQRLDDAFDYRFRVCA